MRRLQTPFVAVLALLALIAADPGWSVAKSKQFYSGCSYSAKARKLTYKVFDEAGEIRRRGGLISPGVRCRGGKATVKRTDRIKFVVKAEGQTTGTLSLAGGPFAPGAAFEAFGPEIEIKMLIADSFAETRIEGSAGGDVLRGGAMGSIQGFNLNADAELLAPDVDLRLIKSEARFSEFDLGSGDDVLDMGGGPGFSGPMKFRTALVFLGDGNDQLIGSDRRDFVIESAGTDTYATGAGDDAIHSQDGVPEIVDCGLGSDRVWPDAQDTTVSCEEVGFVGISD
jgi:hypothetical protein